jgi:hypothetical protein
MIEASLLNAFEFAHLRRTSGRDPKKSESEQRKTIQTAN